MSAAALVMGVDRERSLEEAPRTGEEKDITSAEMRERKKYYLTYLKHVTKRDIFHGARQLDLKIL